MKQTISALQGHPYMYDGHKVIALEYGQSPKVLFLNPDNPAEWRTQYVMAQFLIPQPLRYLHGQTPQ